MCGGPGVLGALLQRLALVPRAVDARERLVTWGCERDSGLRGVGAGLAAIDLWAERQALGGVLRALRAGEQRAAEEEAMPRPSRPACVVPVDRGVDERGALVVAALDAERAEDRSLDADARVRSM